MYLPLGLQAELAAFRHLSDDVLWLIARSTLSEAERKELAALNANAKVRPLPLEEDARSDVLVDKYDYVMVRRAEAAALLRSRGHDLSDLFSVRV